MAHLVMRQGDTHLERFKDVADLLGSHRKTFANLFELHLGVDGDPLEPRTYQRLSFTYAEIPPIRGS
ncbi:hypothetical protein BGX26_009275, partial [Mortierella sp. AD094]